MTNQDITVELEKRETVGKGLAGIRAGGRVPAVIHDHGKTSIHVQGELSQLLKVYSAAGKHHPVQLIVDGKHHLALIKDVDFDPAKHRMRHIVFQAVKQNEAVEAEIPVVFKEDTEIPAEKISLLVLKQLDHVQVKALPKDLPDELIVDPSVLAAAGDSITVADLKVPATVTVLTPEDTTIATVEVPKDQIAEADAAAASLAEDAGTPEDAAVQEPAGEQKEATEEE